MAVLFPFINFAFLVFILWFFGRKAIKELFLKNKQDYEEKKHLAQTTINTARKRHDEVSQKWNNLENELQDIQKKTEASIQKEAEDIVVNAKKMGTFIEAEAKKTAEVEVDLARKNLYQEILSKVMANFESELKNPANKGLHEKIIAIQTQKVKELRSS